MTILATLSPLYFLLFCFYAAIQGTVQRAEEGATKTKSAVQFPVALPPFGHRGFPGFRRRACARGRRSLLRGLERVARQSQR